MNDLISRQAAIDIERNATVDTNPSHFEAHQKFTQFIDDAEISSFGRWQWSNGFNTALTAVGIDLKKLPSAQPEITLESAIDYLHSIGWMQEHDRILTESAQPERKKGKWIDGFCSECHHEAITEWDERGGEYALTRYCPYCGAKMEE